jgi:hypothetical protein
MYACATTLQAAATSVHGLATGLFFSVTPRKYVGSTSNRSRRHPATSCPLQYSLFTLWIISMAVTFNNPQINIEWPWRLRHQGSKFRVLFIAGLYATSRKLAGFIPDGIIEIFHWLNPSGRSMALGSTRPLTEITTSGTSWGCKDGRCLGLTNLPPSYASVSWNPKACNRIALFVAGNGANKLPDVLI